MIDVNDLKSLECLDAHTAVDQLYKARLEGDIPRKMDIEILRKFVISVENLQLKYIKPVAALLKGPNG